MKPRVDTLLKQSIKEFNWKGALPRALFKEIFRNSCETARRRAIQNNLAGIQLKRRVAAPDKGIQLKWRVGAHWVQILRNSIETARRRAIQRSVEEFNGKTARERNSIETARRHAIQRSNWNRFNGSGASQEFNWNGASTCYSKKQWMPLRVDAPFQWKRRFEGIQLKRRVDTLSKRSIREFKWKGASTRCFKKRNIKELNGNTASTQYLRKRIQILRASALITQRIIAEFSWKLRRAKNIAPTRSSNKY